MSPWKALQALNQLTTICILFLKAVESGTEGLQGAGSGEYYNLHTLRSAASLRKVQTDWSFSFLNSPIFTLLKKKRDRVQSHVRKTAVSKTFCSFMHFFPI
jgi:hypothetical protein